MDIFVITTLSIDEPFIENTFVYLLQKSFYRHILNEMINNEETAAKQHHDSVAHVCTLHHHMSQ